MDSKELQAIDLIIPGYNNFVYQALTKLLKGV